MSTALIAYLSTNSVRCGDNGDECPELPSFNGEDYFDDKVCVGVRCSVRSCEHGTCVSLCVCVCVCVCVVPCSHAFCTCATLHFCARSGKAVCVYILLGV